MMAKDLFEIFPDLPSPRLAHPPARKDIQNVEYPPPPTTTVARRRIPTVDREKEVLALRKLHQADTVALRRIRDIAQAEYDRLTPKDRSSRVLRTIVALAGAGR